MEYKKTIGLEVHVELKTNTKIFSDSLNAYVTMANTHVNVVDLGYPGVLPTVNVEVINKAIKAAKILNCTINKKMHFDRKNYFYPDLPKGYQITQSRTPIGVNGYVEIEVNGVLKKIRIHDIHIEEDTCKSIHYNNSTLLNFNRAGVGLLEIVTDADLESGEEAKLYLEKLREMLLYADISDCKIEEGSMRCDANISVSKSCVLGTKIEVKNIGSITNVAVAIDYEAKRQIDLLESGEALRQETRRFDDKSLKTVLMRVKESGNDYRYFPEPDIPFVVLSDDYINEVIKDIPSLADYRRKRLIEGGVSLLNANKVIQNKSLCDFLNNVIDSNINLVIATNILLGDIKAYLNKMNVDIWDTNLSSDKFIELVNMLDSGKLNNKVFKDILDEVMNSCDSVSKIFDRCNVLVIDDDKLLSIIRGILDSNSSFVDEYKNGNDRILKYLMGLIMKEVKGSADPKKINSLLLECLKN